MPKAKREYRNDAIIVVWDAERCIHSGNCVQGLPQVFNPRDRPWVHVDAASAGAIAQTVLTCPSGALHFERLDSGPQEQPQTPAEVALRPNGPLFVRGDLEIRDAMGELIRKDTRVALCRCGYSRHKPFCDNSHLMAGFRDPGLAPEEG